MTEAPVRHADTIIFPASLDPKAVTVVERLTEAGYESYLVGGCVRDLLLGYIPKDFDVSTEARPRQIRRVFRNCRVIGRRFKLAHVHFGQLVIEVATFRRNPEAGELEGEGEGDGGGENNDAESDDLLIVRDNVYGTAEEDARRRDFTMNALLYDVGAAEVHDYVGGFEDLQARVLRTIGEPEVRLAEDPVRMLRAIKFTSRLSLTLDPALDAAIHACAGEIEKSAPPRVLEEIYKLLSCGKAEVSLAMLLDYGLLKRLLPDVGAYWEDHRERLVALGRALDQLDHGQRQLSNALMMSVLYHDPWRAQVDADERGDPMAMARDLISPAAVGMSVPRRDVGRLKGLLTTQLRLERPKRGRRMRMTEFLGRGAVQEAIQLLYLRCLAGGADPEVHAAWAERLAWHLGDGGRDEIEVEAPPSEGRSRRRRRRGGRRNRRGGREGRGGDDRREPAHEGSGRSDGSSKSDRPGSRERPARKADKAKDEATVAPKPQDASPAAETERPAREPAASPKASVSRPTPTPTEKKGLKGFMGRLVRKVLGQEDDQEAPREGSTDGAPQAADAAPSSPPASATEAQAGSKSKSKSKDAEAAAPSEQAPYGPAQQSEGDSPRPKRRRRRRRRSKGDGTSDGAARGSAEGDAASEDSGGAKSDASDSEGESRSSSSGRRSRRRRGGSKEGGRSSGGKSSEKGGSKRGSKPGGSKGGKSGGRSGSKSGGRSGGKGGSRDGSRSRSNGSDDNRRSRSDSGRDRDMDPTKPSEPSGPSQRHPEDVEDIFDW
jgi:poly(A) polymerase